MDERVLNAYGWEDIKLAHDFYEVDYLPENDRVRYTISPDARKEVLNRQMGYDLTQVRDGIKEIISILLICQKSCEQLLDKHET